jgi:hypothetical protein
VEFEKSPGELEKLPVEFEKSPVEFEKSPVKFEKLPFDVQAFRKLPGHCIHLKPGVLYMGRFLGIIGQDPNVPKSNLVTCCDFIYFIYFPLCI